MQIRLEAAFPAQETRQDKQQAELPETSSDHEGIEEDAVSSLLVRAAAAAPSPDPAQLLHLVWTPHSWISQTR